MMKTLEKKYKDHQFYPYYESVIINDFFANSKIIQTLNSSESSFAIALKSAIMNYSFELIIYLSQKTLVYDINMFTSQNEYSDSKAFKEYISTIETRDGLNDFFKKYPELKKRVKDEINAFLSYAENFYQHYVNEEKYIRDFFDLNTIVAEINFGQGDTHNGKKTVIRLKFSDEQTLYYKPSNYKVINLLKEVEDFIQSNGLNVFHVPTTLVRKDHSWQEGIKYEDCKSVKDVQAIYYQYGVLAFIAYYFSATDLHMQNLIIKKNKLYLIDVETFFQADIKRITRSSVSSYLYEMLKCSPLATGLFPFQFSKSNQPDLSGICGKAGQKCLNGSYKLVNRFQGNMKLIKTEYVTEAGGNIPFLNKSYVEPREFTSYICKGYEDVFNLFSKYQSYIERLLFKYQNLKTRLLVRNTSDYGKFMLVATNPKFMIEHDSRKKLFNKFKDIVTDDNHFAIFVDHEVNSLMAGDIPYFLKDLKGNIFDGKLNQIGTIPYNTPLNSEYLPPLNKKILSTHLEWITVCLAKPQKKWETGNASLTNFDFKEVSYTSDEKIEIILQESEGIAAKLINRSYESNSEISWFNIDISFHEQWVIAPFDNSLYSGLTGNALLFLALYKITNKQEYLRILKKIIFTIENNRKLMDDNKLSVFIGIGSLLYLYFNLWIVLKDLVYLDKFKILLNELDQAEIEKADLDYLAGLAGLAIILVNFSKVLKNNTIIEKTIDKIGKTILEKSINAGEDYTFWKSDISDSESLNGLSHGLSGISYALSKIWSVTKEDDYRITALKSIAYENTRFINGNWIDLRNQENRQKMGFPDPVYWCHGAPGIGIARVKISEVFLASDVQKDVYRAMNITEKLGKLKSDCACHGNLGNLEFLNLASHSLNDLQYRNKLVDYLVGMIEVKSNNWRSGIPQNTMSMNFMLGEAGIAYHLLRIAFPDSIPSILALDCFER